MTLYITNIINNKNTFNQILWDKLHSSDEDDKVNEKITTSILKKINYAIRKVRN